MGLDEQEVKNIVALWREKNPAIVNFWKRVDGAAKRTMRTKKNVDVNGLVLNYDGTYLTIKLPSGRKLFYYKPTFCENRFGGESIRYKGINQDTKKFDYIETYGGKLTENIVQAIARDLLAYSMLQLDAAGFRIVMHVHDEAVCEVPEIVAGDKLREMIRLMEIRPPWAQDLPLAADGYLSKYYKKD